MIPGGYPAGRDIREKPRSTQRREPSSKPSLTGDPGTQRCTLGEPSWQLRCSNVYRRNVPTPNLDVSRDIERQFDRVRDDLNAQDQEHIHEARIAYHYTTTEVARTVV